jgi:Amt family ammonium transporter
MPAVLTAIAAIGAVGGVIVVFAVPLLDKLKIDDVVGAIPVHLLAGIWGTFIVPLSNPDMSYGTQILGIVSIGVFTFVVSGVIWFILKSTVGIRATEEQEMMGMDMAEVGVEAYPAGLPSGTALDWHLPPGRSSWCWVVCQERRHGRGQQGWETR